ncbi:MAG: hypothetical protein ACOCYD_00005 [bacterium]
MAIQNWISRWNNEFIKALPGAMNTGPKSLSLGIGLVKRLKVIVLFDSAFLLLS